MIFIWFGMCRTWVAFVAVLLPESRPVCNRGTRVSIADLIVFSIAIAACEKSSRPFQEKRTSTHALSALHSFSPLRIVSLHVSTCWIKGIFWTLILSAGTSILWGSSLWLVGYLQVGGCPGSVDVSQWGQTWHIQNLWRGWKFHTVLRLLTDSTLYALWFRISYQYIGRYCCSQTRFVTILQSAHVREALCGNVP